MAPWWVPVALAIVALALAGLATNLETARRELRRLGTRVEFTVEYFHRERALISHPGYGPLRSVLKEKFDRHGAQLVGLGPARQAAHSKFGPGRWRYLFLSHPADEESLVWRNCDQRVVTSDYLLFRQIWSDLLDGHPEAEEEPYLVIQRARERDEPVFRIFLKRRHAGEPSAILCNFPIVLMTEHRAERARQIALRFGMRVVTNRVIDYYENEFGEHHLVFQEGQPGYVYETDLFKFLVRDTSPDY